MSHMTAPWLKLHKKLGMAIPAFEDRPLGSYVEEHALTRPDAPAMFFMGQVITCAQMNKAANGLANALSAAGIAKGDVVGLHLPNLPHYLIGLIAVSKLGAIGTGISPLLAPPEVAYQLENSDVQLVLSYAGLAPVLGAIDHLPACLRHVVLCYAGDSAGAADISDPDLLALAIEGVNVTSYQRFVDGMSEDYQQQTVYWNDTFMIQYTGGTTGRPKGAQLSHRSLMHNPMQVHTGDPAILEEGEVLASAFPMFHVAGLSFALSSAMIGASLYIIPNPRDTDYFVKLLTKHPPTRMAAVPALYDMLLGHPEFRNVDFSKLMTAKTGAAPMPEVTRARLDEVFGRKIVSDVFGMTETGPCYTCHPLSALRRGSVGIPVPGSDVRIMDVETGEKEMPRGEPGEICAAGPQIMKGYLGLPEENAKALRYIGEQQYMYSGDVGYMDEDGYIFLCDRAKDMLIVGGFKVFSVEVEDKLKSLPYIAQSAIIGVPDKKRPGNDVVNLFVEISDRKTYPDEEYIRQDIRAFFKENMAPYKNPKAIHFIDSIPLTPVGKIDKKILRENLVQ